MQPNGNDCGPFAIVFAMTISSGQAPEDLLFHVEQMSHLTSCFEKNEMKPYPSRKRCVKKKNRKKNEAVAVHGKCRLLDSNKMVCCDTCGTWYHNTGRGIYHLKCGTLTALDLSCMYIVII